MSSNTNKRVSDTSPHIQGVNATAGGLVKATLGAAAVAAAILTFIWLPAEFGFDPTGVGSKLGLKQMGQIKQRLHAEADAKAAATASAGASSATGSAEIMARLDAMDNRLAAIAATVGVPEQLSSQTKDAAPAAQQTDTALWTDEADYTLEPGKAIEVKLVMTEGATADFEWTANGGLLNHDTHGDAADDGREINYSKGRSVPEHGGQLVAAFTGEHGWFWRNRTNESVVVTLRTRGEYSEIKEY